MACSDGIGCQFCAIGVARSKHGWLGEILAETFSPNMYYLEVPELGISGFVFLQCSSKS